jgi:hypothetical protein
LVLGIVATVGCTSSVGGKASSAGDEVVVDDYIDIPAAKVEEVTVAPSEEEIWIPGYWERDPGEWTWVKGRWAKPPHEKAYWQNGHWKWRDGQWHWSRGHWAAGERVVVTKALPVPAPQVEVITKEPSKEHVWIPGSWERDPDEWTWVAGRWEKPPEKSAHWEPGHWNWNEGEWHWDRGHWANGDVGLIVDQIIDVPALLTETKPPKPSEKHHWVAGYWEWDEHWIWIPGYWTSLPDPNATWVAGHWDEYGTHPGEWRWISGHWQVS